jgi:AraC family transcriptional regulator
VLTNSSPTNLESYFPFDRGAPGSSQPPMVLSLDRGPILERRHDWAAHESRSLSDRPAANTLDCAVAIAPSGAVMRRAAIWDGMAAEIVQVTRHESIEFSFRAPRHLLAVYEQGVRRDGDTLVEGLPRSALRSFKGKLTFVPAGHEYYERYEPSVLTRVVYFYLEPEKMPTLVEAGCMNTALAPRLFFEDATLWDTALKLKRLVGTDNRPYFDALGVVLAHELVRLNAGYQRIEAAARGGLAGWQQRIATAYIEEHVAEQIPLATLAQLVRLSPSHFCRAFKQSLGVPPHRYHNNRRIEHAKTLLAKPAPSVTDIALTLGFSETSSFTAAFRKATGITPTTYHRSLG